MKKSKVIKVADILKQTPARLSARDRKLLADMRKAAESLRSEYKDILGEGA